MRQYIYQIHDVNADSYKATIALINLPVDMSDDSFRKEVDKRYLQFIYDYNKQEDTDEFRSKHCDYYIFNDLCQELGGMWEYLEITGDMNVGDIRSKHDAFTMQ